jgi:hypothetical protein
MRVSRLDKFDDWTMGQHLTGSQAVAQCVKTRIRSFKNDWFLDMGAGIDWLRLLGARGTQKRILREVERVALGTPGVVRLTGLDMRLVGRQATISLSYIDAYRSENNLTVEI